ncbi:MAG TPA: valine--tRNA ligase [Acidobacteriaceae bacterium]
MRDELPKAYDPAAIEEHWAEYWVSESLFHATSLDQSPTQGNFTMLLPPPNVTGRLHMGHMLNQTEMDILARWHRMRGDRTLWVPGTDHAGIATQMMVERQLASERTSRHKLGREAFLERVWKWKEQYGGAILDQMKRLGASVDWSREYFTMDAGLSRAVREAFVRLHEQGLIYRGAYIVNWCPDCQTAISDLEVIHEEQLGKLYTIPYGIVGSNESLLVATTRPETMFGDVAVAVHPIDERYRHLQGASVRVPFINREIPIVADPWVSPEFGTGAVKITPAHDPNDYAVGQRHKLQSINIMDETAHLNDIAGPFAGLDRFEARKRIVAELEDQPGYSVKEHSHAVGKCDRSKTVVEPRLSTQWFIKIQPLAEKAIAAVDQGHIRFTPEQYRKTYDEWMRNIHDWCISRQLWWGHRIPAWHCAACDKVTVARETPEACQHCNSKALSQETDVLDTWFSSGLLPISVFGWPDQTSDLAAFYPTELLVTGFDILFFWVARMIMFGCHFMLDVPMPDGSARTLKDAVPFREVYIHALVRDAERQKMSKTKGNVIDPIEIVKRYGTDAVRFTLATMASPGTDIAFSEARTEGYRAFANKIWNAARFLFMQRERVFAGGGGMMLGSIDLATVDRNEAVLLTHPANPDAPKQANEVDESHLEDRWILSRLYATAATVNSALEAYRFDEAAHAIYQFFWGDLCDWYLELVKLRTETESQQDGRLSFVLFNNIFESSLRMLSPFMPFITEEIWHAFYNGHPPARSIALMPYPVSAQQEVDEGSEAQMAQLQSMIVSIRAARKDAGVPERESVPVLLRTDDASVFQQNLATIQRLARVTTLEVVAQLPDGLAHRATPAFDVAVVYEKPVDTKAERERLSKELAKLHKEKENSDRQLGNESFLAKAPAPVVEGIRRRNAELATLIERTRTALDGLPAA